MILMITCIIILRYHAASLTLSVKDGRISDSVADKNNPDTDFDKLDRSLFEEYPVVVPQNLILQICLKESLLLDKLHSNKKDCDGYPCMFSKIIEDESMKSLLQVLQNDTIDSSDHDFKQCVQDCSVWWKLFKNFDKKSNPRSELGKCLFQTFSSKCRQNALSVVKSLLFEPKQGQK